MSTSQVRKEILKQKSDEYISRMELPEKFLDYDDLAADQLLLIEAVNDWSGRALVEGGAVKLNFNCDNSCCATAAELNECVNRLRKSMSVIYPVSGFDLSDEDKLVFFSEFASYRMVPHVTGSRADAICIAEVKKVQDVEAAMGLWSFCAVEDCIAYLDYQLDLYKLALGEEDRVAIRQIVASFLQGNFSIGQIWRAMWGAAQDVAALSKRQYFNNEKAVRTVVKNIDHRLTKAVGNQNYSAYARIAQRPLGAVLTLFLNRFDITDATTGAEVRTRFIADAAIHSSLQEGGENFDRRQEYIRGSMYFFKKFTKLDRLVISCFKGISLEVNEPEWDNSHVMGRINFSLSDLFCFDCAEFLFKLFPLLGVDSPSSDDILRLTAGFKNDIGEMAGRSVADQDLSWGVVEAALVKGGLTSDNAAAVLLTLGQVIVPGEVVSVVRRISIPAGIFAVRVEDVDVSGDGVFNYNEIFADDFVFSIPESNFHPVGNDLGLVVSLVNKDFESLANLVAVSVFGSVRCESLHRKNQLLTLISRRLLEMVKPLDGKADVDA